LSSLRSAVRLYSSIHRYIATDRLIDIDDTLRIEPTIFTDTSLPASPTPTIQHDYQIRSTTLSMPGGSRDGNDGALINNSYSASRLDLETQSPHAGKHKNPVTLVPYDSESESDSNFDSDERIDIRSICFARFLAAGTVKEAKPITAPLPEVVTTT
jgi:hypothetical protein